MIVIIPGTELGVALQHIVDEEQTQANKNSGNK